MGGYLEVELDEEPGGASGPSLRRPVLPASWLARGRRAGGDRGWTLVAAGLAVLVAATSIGAGTAAARAARTTGLTTDLTVPRSEVWRADGVIPPGVAGDVLVVQTGTGAAGLRLADGGEVWRAEDGGCSLTDLVDPLGSVTVFGGLATSGGELRLVCTEWGGEVTTVVREPRSGRELLRVTAGEGDVAVVGTSLVVVDRGEPATVQVWSLATGELRWQREVEGPVLGVQVFGETIVLGPNQADGFDLATGAVVVDPARGDGEAILRLRLRGGLVAETRLAAETGVVAVVSDAAGVELWRVAGLALPMPVDAPAARDLLPVAEPDGDLAGYDLASGELRWTFELSQGYPVLGAAGVLGVALLDSSGNAAGLLVLDPATGAELWRTEAAFGPAWPTLACDGSRLGLPEEVGGQWVLVVRDLRTGALVSTWPLAEGGVQSVLGLPDGRLVQVSETGVVLLG